MALIESLPKSACDKTNPEIPCLQDSFATRVDHARDKHSRSRAQCCVGTLTGSVLDGWHTCFNGTGTTTYKKSAGWTLAAAKADAAAKGYACSAPKGDW